MALANMDSLLSDHAHCELKAAQNALSLIARHGAEAPSIVAPLTELAQEEASHFGRVHGYMKDRGIPFRPPTSDAYAVQLRQASKASRGGWPALLDRLIVASLIEARSAERFILLERNVEDNELKDFYRELMASEAGHYRLFLDIASTVFEKDAAKTRFREMALLEAQVLRDLPLSPTIHG